ncbi:RidA family protein [Spirosoma sp. SC4-14]|uniref:RidA family protein n=1 Tax=Spirosoma sp. SC4-14 TaxID=3128900 RepID=UPI0030D42DDE
MRYTVLTFLLLVVISQSYGQALEETLKKMGIELYPPTKSAGNYLKAVRTGNLLFLAGHVSTRADGTPITGKLGKDLTIEQGYEAARITGISLLSTIKNEVGELGRVKRIVKLTGFVNSTPEFTDHPKVVNGCSDLLVALWGDKGKHARSAVGMAALPSNYAVEIEMIVELEDQ